MSKYIVETFYTCTFKIVHKLDELNEKKLSELENQKDGKVQIIDVKLNNRKTRKTSQIRIPKNLKNDLPETNISNVINEKIISSDKLRVSNENDLRKTNIQKFDNYLSTPQSVLQFVLAGLLF